MIRPIAATVTALALGAASLTTALPAAADTSRDPIALFHAHPAAAPVPGAVLPEPFLQVATPTNIHIGSSSERVPVAANLSVTKEVYLVAVLTDSSDDADVVGAHAIQPAKPTAKLRTTVDVESDSLPRLGSYVFGIAGYDVDDADDAVVYTPTTIRRNSLLGLSATRSGDTITVSASARQYLIPSDSYEGWTNRTIGIQRYTSSGWVNIRTVTTDENGNVTVKVRVPFKTALRARVSDTGATWGAVSSIQIR